MTSPVPVLWVIKGLGPGGAEHLLVEFARHADRERFRYRCCYLMPEKDHLAASLRSCGVEVRCLGMRNAADPTWVRRLRRTVTRQRPAIVHAHLPYAAVGSRIAVRSLGRRRPRMISTEHNTADRYRAPTRWADAATLRLDDRTIAVSRSVATSFHRARGIEVIPNGVDLEGLRSLALGREEARRSLGVPSAAPVVGTVGGITPKKGHRVLLEAARRVVALVPRATFVLVGLPIAAEELEREVAATGLEDRVIFAGYRENAAQLMQAFDVLCLPSLHEGLPLSVLEGLALGVPVVASSVGGVPEVIDDRTGVLVPSGDATALAEALLGLLEDPDRRARLSAAGAAASERFDVRETVRRTEALYLETLRGRA